MTEQTETLQTADWQTSDLTEMLGFENWVLENDDLDMTRDNDPSMYKDHRTHYIWQIWKDAVHLERERCAKLAEAHFIPGHSVAGKEFSDKLAALLRMPPNAKVTRP